MLISKKSGFTLIELLCVIAVLGVLSGMFCMNMNSKAFWSNIRLKFATKELISNLRYAKVCGISKQGATIQFKFIYDSANACYTGYQICNASNLAKPVIKEVKLEKGIYIDRYQSTFDHGYKYIEFHYNGSLDSACSIVIKDKESGSARRVTLTIGYTRVMEIIL